MVLNPPLLLVSPLFFLALASLLYLVAWGVTSLFLRCGHLHLSQSATKHILIVGLVVPPLLSLMLTVGGATLHHMHNSRANEHHSVVCGQIFTRLSNLGNAVGILPFHEFAGIVANGTAWFLVGCGVFFVLRLIRATTSLERGLTPYLNTPTPRLVASLSRVEQGIPNLPVDRFFECPIPATYSSVLGFWQARCILSQNLVSTVPEEELDAVVAHEACHLRAGDVLVTFLVGALNCLFFYLQPVRLLGRAWREAAELACDDAAVTATRQPRAMAAAILRASGIPFTIPTLPTVSLAFADETACLPAKRVERLLDQAQRASFSRGNESGWQATVAWLVTLIFAGAGIALLSSADAACFAHCTLEGVAHIFR